KDDKRTNFCRNNHSRQHPTHRVTKKMILFSPYLLFIPSLFAVHLSNRYFSKLFIHYTAIKVAIRLSCSIVLMMFILLHHNTQLIKEEVLLYRDRGLKRRCFHTQ